jgi:hypothetical protein
MVFYRGMQVFILKTIFLDTEEKWCYNCRKSIFSAIKGRGVRKIWENILRKFAIQPLLYEIFLIIFWWLKENPN